MNGPLQGRTNVLDLDEIRANRFPDDYDTDVEFAWSDQSNSYLFLSRQVERECDIGLFVDGDDHSWESVRKGRNVYYQQEKVKEMIDRTKKTISLLSDALNNHLNVGQNQTINTSSVLMSYQTMTIASLSNKTIQPMKNLQVDLQSNINSTSTSSQRISLRVCFDSS